MYYHYKTGVSLPVLKRHFKLFALAIAGLFIFTQAILFLQSAIAAPAANQVENQDTLDVFNTIQEAIDDPATLDGHTLLIGAGTFSEDVNVTKDLTFIGSGQGTTIIDASSGSDYGFSDHAAGVDVVIQDLTLQNSSTYGIKFSNGGNATVSNVTVIGSGESEFDFNGMSSVQLNDVTADGQNTSGVGIGISDSDNITITNATTTGNIWGGVGLFTCGNHYPPAGIDNVTITGLNASEPNPLYEDRGFTCPETGVAVTNLNASQFNFAVTNDEFQTDGSLFVMYQEDLTDATNAAASLHSAPWTPNTDSAITRLSDGWRIVPADVGLTIKAAVEDTPAGGVVHLLNGNHVYDTEQIVIDKAITLSGEDKNATIVKSQFDTGTSADSRGWFLVESTGVLDMSSITLDGDDQKVHQAVRNKGAGSVDNVIFKNFSHDSYTGTAYVVFGVSPVDVTNSIFENIGRVGVLYWGSDVSGSVYSGNTYTGKGPGDWLDYALDISNGAEVTVSNNNVTNNRGVASSDGSSSAGYLVTTFFGAGTSAEFNDNTISNNSTGIYVGYDENDTSTASGRNNKFSGNDTAVQSTAQLVDFRENYWGDNSGPTDTDAGDDSIPATNPGGTGDVAGDWVWYENWQTVDVTLPTVTDLVLNGENVTSPRDVNCGPTDFNLVNGLIDLSATITDDSGVDSARYKIRKVTAGGCTQASIYNSGNVNMSNSSGDSWVTLPGTELDTNDVPEDGDYTIQMTVKDEVGNTVTKYIDITVDNTAPSVPVIEHPSDEQYFNSAPILNDWTDSTDTNGIDRYQIAYYYDDGHTFGGSTCPGLELDGNVVSGCRDTTASQRNHTPALTEQGGVTIWVRAFDNAGNASDWSESVHYYYDETPPATPTNLELFESGGDEIANGGYTNSYGVMASWDAVGDANHYEYRYWNSIPGNTYNEPNYYETNPTNTSQSGVFNQGEGLHHIQVRAVDDAGNKSPWSTQFDVTYDTTAPSVPNHVFPGDGTVLNSSDLYIDWDESTDNLTPQNDIRYEYRLYLVDPDTNPGATIRFSQDYTGTTRHPVSGFAPGTPEDTYFWRVRACDQTENCSYWSEAWEFTVDNTAPEQVQGLQIRKGHSAGGEVLGCGGYTNTTQIRIEWNFGSEEDIDYYWLGTKFNPKHKKVDASKNFYLGNMTPGNNPYHYTVIAVDKAGNESLISAQCELTLDQEAPAVEVTSHNDDDIVIGNITIEGVVTDDNPSHYWFVLQDESGNYIAGPNVVNDTNSPANASFDFDTTSVPDGTYYIKLEARDAAGNKAPNEAPVLSDPETISDSVDWVRIYIDNDQDSEQTDVNGIVLTCTTDQDSETGSAGVIGNTNGSSAISGEATNENDCIFIVKVNENEGSVAGVTDYKNDGEATDALSNNGVLGESTDDTQEGNVLADTGTHIWLGTLLGAVMVGLTGVMKIRPQVVRQAVSRLRR